MLYEVLSTRLDVELKAEIENFAIRHDLDNSAVIRLLCQKFSNKLVEISQEDIELEKQRLSDSFIKSARRRRKPQRVKKLSA